MSRPDADAVHARLRAEEAEEEARAVAAGERVKTELRSIAPEQRRSILRLFRSQKE
jgi:hypothetical protein